jgi:aldehyde dehydrogenase (NAD+)
MALEEGFGIRLSALRQRAQEQRLEDWRSRRERLKALREAVKKRRADLQKALASDLGRAVTETDIVEFLPTFSEIETAIANVKRWSRSRSVKTPITFFGLRSEVLPQPKGVCLIIAPWNYPVLLAIGPLASAIAAGNTVVIKPSEFTPASSALIREIVSEALDPAEALVVEGGPEVSEALLRERFDHIFFTGSPQVGRIVMAAAAKGPTSVTLELGGKSPAYVHKSADLKDTAAKLVWAKYLNAGQTCIAPDYILADTEIAEPLKQALAARIAKVYPREIGEGMRGPDLAAIVSPRHAERLSAMIQEAQGKGARVLAGGQSDPGSRFVAPTLMDNISSDMRLAQEEIFGPILPVITVSGPQAAIDHVNSAAPPLASYIFTKDGETADRYIAAAPAGGSCVNTALVQFGNENLPFGGIGSSGIGRSHGEAGFEAFSNMRAVMRDRFSMIRLIFPPYTASVRRQFAAMLKLKRAA